jgi:hypothetical protein
MGVLATGRRTDNDKPLFRPPVQSTTYEDQHIHTKPPGEFALDVDSTNSHTPNRGDPPEALPSPHLSVYHTTNFVDDSGYSSATDVEDEELDSILQNIPPASDFDERWTPSPTDVTDFPMANSCFFKLNEDITLQPRTTTRFPTIVDATTKLVEKLHRLTLTHHKKVKIKNLSQRCWEQQLSWTPRAR